ncbi:hypothetical protein WMZ97_16595 [Lentibacillus sp. N15]|uniref:CD3337/EF1877 family mobilome membrane protein n=1 Tax=Lentibacillus songyuanensis TaxID=3136161 RepID=UPI0031BB3747
MKRNFFIVLSLFVLSFTFFPSNIAFALDKDFETKENFDDGEVNRSQYSVDGEKFYYKLEAGMPDDDKAGFFNVLGKASDAISVGLNETIMLINKVIFSLNITFTKWMIGTFEMTQDFKFIDKAIDKTSDKVTDMVGISGYYIPSFTSGGMFSTLFGIMALVVILYAFYQLVWKRSFVSSFGELFKFIIVLTVALLLFTNYSSFLKGMNIMSTEIGNFVVGSQVDQNNHNSRVNNFSKTLWDHFVDKPYFSLQYGTSDLSELNINDLDGKERVYELVTAKTDSKKRKKIIDEEINERENYYMSYDSVPQKTYMTLVYFMLNGITSIPIYLIALSIVFTQFWFVIIALIAPFALLIASFPSQFNVLKRYFFELSLPLLVKIALHFMLIVMMFLTTLYVDMEEEITSNLFSGQLGASYVNALFYTILFFAIFLLRKRIANILSSGSNMVGEIREGLGSVTTKPVKKTVQTTATVAGTAVGAAYGGPMGATMGGNMGATVGKVLTGESDGIAGATQDFTNATYKGQMLKNFAETKKTNGQDNMMNTEDNSNMILAQGKESSDHKLMNENETNENDQENVRDSLNAQGVALVKTDENTLDRHLEQEGEDDRGYPEQLASSLKMDQSEAHQKIEGIKEERTERFNNFLEKQNLTGAEMEGINGALHDKAIGTAYIPRSIYQNVDKDIKNRLDNGETLDYKTEFVNGIADKMKERDLIKQNERMMAADGDLDSHDLKESNTGLPTARLETSTYKGSDLTFDTPNGNNMDSQSLSSSKMRTPIDKSSDFSSDVPMGNMIDSQPLSSKDKNGHTPNSKTVENMTPEQKSSFEQHAPNREVQTERGSNSSTDTPEGNLE